MYRVTSAIQNGIKKCRRIFITSAGIALVYGAYQTVMGGQGYAPYKRAKSEAKSGPVVLIEVPNSSRAKSSGHSDVIGDFFVVDQKTGDSTMLRCSCLNLGESNVDERIICEPVSHHHQRTERTQCDEIHPTPTCSAEEGTSSHTNTDDAEQAGDIDEDLLRRIIEIDSSADVHLTNSDACTLNEDLINKIIKIDSSSNEDDSEDLQNIKSNQVYYEYVKSQTNDQDLEEDYEELKLAFSQRTSSEESENNVDTKVEGCNYSQVQEIDDSTEESGTVVEETNDAVDLDLSASDEYELQVSADGERYLELEVEIESNQDDSGNLEDSYDVSFDKETIIVGESCDEEGHVREGPQEEEEILYQLFNQEENVKEYVSQEEDVVQAENQESDFSTQSVDEHQYLDNSVDKDGSLSELVTEQEDLSKYVNNEGNTSLYENEEADVKKYLNNEGMIIESYANEVENSVKLTNLDGSLTDSTNEQNIYNESMNEQRISDEFTNAEVISEESVQREDNIHDSGDDNQPSSCKFSQNSDNEQLEDERNLEDHMMLLEALNEDSVTEEQKLIDVLNEDGDLSKYLKREEMTNECSKEERNLAELINEGEDVSQYFNQEGNASEYTKEEEEGEGDLVEQTTQDENSIELTNEQQDASGESVNDEVNVDDSVDNGEDEPCPCCKHKADNNEEEENPAVEEEPESSVDAPADEPQTGGGDDNSTEQTEIVIIGEEESRQICLEQMKPKPKALEIDEDLSSTQDCPLYADLYVIRDRRPPHNDPCPDRMLKYAKVETPGTEDKNQVFIVDPPDKDDYKRKCPPQLRIAGYEPTVKKLIADDRDGLSSRPITSTYLDMDPGVTVGSYQPCVTAPDMEHTLYLLISVRPEADLRFVASQAARIQEFADTIENKKLPPMEMQKEKDCGEYRVVAGVGFGPWFYQAVTSHQRAKEIGGGFEERDAPTFRNPRRGLTLDCEVGGDILVHAKASSPKHLKALSNMLLSNMPKGSVAWTDEVIGNADPAPVPCTRNYRFTPGTDLARYTPDLKKTGKKDQANKSMIIVNQQGGEESETKRREMAIDPKTGGTFCLALKWLHHNKKVHPEQAQKEVTKWLTAAGQPNPVVDAENPCQDLEKSRKRRRPQPKKTIKCSEDEECWMDKAYKKCLEDQQKNPGQQLFCAQGNPRFGQMLKSLRHTARFKNEFGKAKDGTMVLSYAPTPDGHQKLVERLQQSTFGIGRLSNMCEIVLKNSTHARQACFYFPGLLELRDLS